MEEAYQTPRASHLLIQLTASGSLSQSAKVKQRYSRATTVKTKSPEPIPCQRQGWEAKQMKWKSEFPANHPASRQAPALQPPVARSCCEWVSASPEPGVPISPILPAGSESALGTVSMPSMHARPHSFTGKCTCRWHWARWWDPTVSSFLHGICISEALEILGIPSAPLPAFWLYPLAFYWHLFLLDPACLAGAKPTLLDWWFAESPEGLIMQRPVGPTLGLSQWVGLGEACGCAMVAMLLARGWTLRTAL